MSAKAIPTGRQKPITASEAKARPIPKRAWSLKPLLTDVRGLILQSRGRMAQTVNAELTLLYWHIGTRIHKDILKEKRAEYGQEVLQSLSPRLVAEFGRGFSERNLANMVRFAEVFPDLQILQSLIAKLGWTHLQKIIYLDHPLKREFYAEMCRIENWSTRTLQKEIQSMLFERTALSKKPEKLIRQELDALKAEGRLTPDLVFRDPYVLDFLGLADSYSEQDLEAAILREMESFILELGVGFCFVERQKRMQIDNEDYYLDLLFYHRKLHRLVAIDLKIGDFKAADKGQMELYLAWLNRYACESDEESSLGIILCAGKNQQHVELLEPHKSGIHVASYWKKALPKAALEKKLRDAMRFARARLEHQGKDA